MHLTYLHHFIVKLLNLVLDIFYYVLSNIQYPRLVFKKINFSK